MVRRMTNLSYIEKAWPDWPNVRVLPKIVHLPKQVICFSLPSENINSAPISSLAPGGSRDAFIWWNVYKRLQWRSTMRWLFAKGEHSAFHRVDWYLIISARRTKHTIVHSWASGLEEFNKCVQDVRDHLKGEWAGQSVTICKWVTVILEWSYRVIRLGQPGSIQPTKESGIPMEN